MSGLNLKIDVKSNVGDRLKKVEASLTDRTDLNEHIGKVAQSFTRDYLIGIAGERHGSAEKLGGTPTGFLAKAAENTSFHAGKNGVRVTIKSPGISRVAHDVTIVPTGGRQWLTIPIAGISYGKTVSQIEGQFGRLFRPWRKSEKGVRAHVLAAKIPDGLKFLFALTKSVTQKQDRTLLPSDKAYMNSTIEGARNYLDTVLFWKEVK